jgi:large subunit ribosomal protein L17
MRHKNAGSKLSRSPSHRKALLRNLAKALLIHGRITTTESKAKALRGVVEPLITLALKNDLHARREAYRVLGEHKLVSRLFDDIGPQFVGGGGGYTRVVKLAVPRKGDAAPLAIIELTKRPEEKTAADDDKASASTKAGKK